MPLHTWLRPVRHAAARLADLLAPPPASFVPSGQTAPVPQPATPHVRDMPVDTAIYGASGTPIMSGFVTDLQEYNPELRGRNALPVYEKMRRSDADVAAVLAACKLPIRSAEFQIVPGAKENEPDYALAKEIAEFVRECLFEDLEYENASGVRFAQAWDSVIENALLCLDFGCSGSEDIWTIDGNRVRLKRIAPRLPLTFYRFHVDADGETLEAVEQWGYRGSQWVTAVVPASKFTLFTLRQEGANFYGRAILREAYQHWYIKYNLYRIDSIACERNGAGVPKIVMGENPSVEDKEYARGWIENLSTHEATGILLPFGWDFALEGVEGQPRDLQPSIQHHSEMICRSALAMFMALGTTQTGSRALGTTMVDFFQLSEMATAKFICDSITETTIRRLVDFNYSSTPGVELPYPRLIVPNIAVLNPIDIMTALKDIASAGVDIVQPDDSTEEWLRKKIGLPLKGTPRPRTSSTSGPGLPPGNGNGNGNGLGPMTMKEKLEGRRRWHGLAISIENDVGSIRRGADGDGKPWAVRMEHPYGYIRRSEGNDAEQVDCYLGPDPKAEFVYVVHQHLDGEYDEDKAMLDFPSADAARQAFERHAPHAPFHSMSVLPIEAFLEKVKATWKRPGKITAVDRLRRQPTRDLRPEEKKHNFNGHCARADQTQTALRRILNSIKGSFFREAARRLCDMSPAQADQFAMPFNRALVARLARAIELAHEYGYKQVFAERYRATGRPSSERRRLADRRRNRPAEIAETAVADLNNGLTVRARSAHVDAWKRGLRGPDLEESIAEDLADASEGWLDRVAMEAARAGVVGGRQSAFDDLGTEIARYVRSEAMDQNTCEVCAAGDGQSWDTLEEVDWVPGDDCEGRDACRGQLMPVFADEGKVIHE